MDALPKSRFAVFLIPIGLVALFVLANYTTYCEHRPTRQEYWAGDGARLIEKAKMDEAAALGQIQTAKTPEERQAAMATAQIFTEVRKRYEAARDGKQISN
jgi:hypothetical protein